MYTVMQYNDLAVAHDNNQQMYGGGPHDMSVNGFLQDDRYQNSSSSGGVLNSTINKLHLQHQQQPSTSRLSNVVANQQPQQPYGNRMRLAQQNPLGQQALINGVDLADSVLLPMSSTSPQNNTNSTSTMYLPQQTVVKNEPDANTDEFFDSTDNESHYSHGETSSRAGGSAKPRKYRIKPESERVNPQYRMKRAKNNDAVRRSREMAKHQQQEKERRLHFLETEHAEHYKIQSSLKMRIRELEAEVLAMQKRCNCGGAQQQVYRR